MLQLSIVASKISTLHHIKQLHAEIIHHSLHHSNYWLSLLINHCTRLRSLPPYPRQIFDSSPCPNTFLSSSMLKYYFQMGAHGDVLRLFVEMRDRALQPDVSVYPILMKSSGKDGILFHSHVVKLGVVSDRFIRNAIMDVYAKSGHMQKARELFDEMPEKAIADWNSILSGYWKWGDEEEACRVFDLMVEKNVVTWTAMVTGYSKIKDLRSARTYFDQMPEKTVVSWNAMMSGYAQNGHAEEALRLFDEMVDAGIQPNDTTWVSLVSSCSSRADPRLAKSLIEIINERRVNPNCFLKNALLDMHAKCGDLAAARKMFEELGGDKKLISWNAMVSAYARVGDLDMARDLFNQMPEKNVVTWNSMISGYAQNGQSVLALELFKEMIKSKDPKPDEVTMASVISACGHLGALDLGNWAVNFIAEHRIKWSISLYNSLICMYSRGGNIKEAVRIFDEMERKDVISYNTLIAGFATHGRALEAIDLLIKMKESGTEPEPDDVTYVGVLTACNHAGLLEEAHKVFRLIKTPNADHYACMIDLLGRMGNLDGAMELTKSMPMEPHAGVYGSLLNASRIYRRLELGEFAANKLFELEPDNSGNYVLLSNMYALAGRWGDVDRIMGAMGKRGVIKTTGWSLVEFGGQMHKFSAGDRSHERAEDIYRLLAELRKRMGKVGYAIDKSCVSRDVEEEEKEQMVGAHSEKLAVAFALLVCEVGATIRVVKNLRVCLDCHAAMKAISKLEGREIILRDNNRFHCFSDGLCSCHDYW